MDDHKKLVLALCKQAMKLEEPLRDGYLDDACGEDIFLRGAVEAQLRSNAAVTADMTKQEEAFSHDSQSGKVMIGASIACYEITGIIGQGGMGSVYEAVQDKPKRTVALRQIC